MLMDSAVPYRTVNARRFQAMRLENITRLTRRAVVAAAALTAATLLTLSPGDAGAEYGLIMSLYGQANQPAATVTIVGSPSGETAVQPARLLDTRLGSGGN